MPTKHFVFALRVRDSVVAESGVADVRPLEPLIGADDAPAGGRVQPAATRLGITASRRIGNAVVRNRMKRLVKEAFRSTRELWPPDLDVVVIVREGRVSLGLGEVVGEWHGARDRILTRVAQARTDARRRAIATGVLERQVAERERPATEREP